MSITDELRAWAKTLTNWWYDPVKDEYTYTTGIMPPSIDAIRLDSNSNITAIADRIDAGHERAMADAYLSGTPTDEKLTELGWIRLPKDADDVPICIGDVMELTRLSNKPSFEVRAMRYDEGGWEVYDRLGDRYVPSVLRHHHAPTVEDVLREFANEVYADADNEIRDRDYLCAKYAKRLTLAEKEDA